MSSTLEKVYIDTMVFLNQLFNKTHRLHSNSERFFHDIENQKYIGITSSFTRSEYLAVIKQELACQLNTVPSREEVDKALEIFDGFLEEMGIEYFDSDELVSFALNKDEKFFVYCYDQILSSRPIKGKDNKWRMLNGADSLVLLFAEACNANRIATNDDGFKGTNSYVIPLIPREVY
jgi:predicted nucleic acid-binding protein